jgi:hypothetical protein
MHMAALPALNNERSGSSPADRQGNTGEGTESPGIPGDVINIHIPGYRCNTQHFDFIGSESHEDCKSIVDSGIAVDDYFSYGAHGSSFNAS